MTLIIVESPTKARTFNRILKGKDYYVFATMGHIRDLAKDKISIDYEKKYKPSYSIIKSKQKIVDKLKELASKNTEIILATDADREGESISYHAAYVLNFIKDSWPNFEIKNENLKRIVFHEITPKALDAALSNPQSLRIPLVKAQQARRILDRIVGYELSPLLWKKTGKNWLSAGRVQTVTLRFIVEREKEIQKFKKTPYYQMVGLFKDSQEISARLISKDQTPYEKEHTMELFDGQYAYKSTSITEKNTKELEKDIRSDTFMVQEISEKEILRYPPPPHTTSLLQQDAFYRFGFSSKLTMILAQGLYERGLITYHRTDSFNLSTHFVFAAKDYIIQKYGKEYALEKPRGYKVRSRLAQEAHEAIRPTRLEQTSGAVSKLEKLTSNHKKLYGLIFQRAVATQMKEAKIKQVTVTISGKKGYLFQSDIENIMFDGFLRCLFPQKAIAEKRTFTVKKSEELKLQELTAELHESQPPRRYNEASLIKALEERGIGRPSTYAPIISLILQKVYVEKDGRYFVPSALGTAISDYLSISFPSVFDAGFTAQMEEKLDLIAQGEQDIVKILDEFYSPFSVEIQKQAKDTKHIEVKEEFSEKCPQCKKGNIIPRFSRFGKFFACSRYPNCKYTRSDQKIVKNKKCPKCEGAIVVKYTKKGKRFFGCANYPKCDFSTWTFKSIQDAKS